MRKLLTTQLFITLSVALFFTLTGGNGWLAAIYGGLITILNFTMLNHGLTLATQHGPENSNMGILILYGGAVIRFVMVMILFAIGIGYLKLQAVPMIAAFALAQLGSLILQIFTPPEKIGEQR